MGGQQSKQTPLGRMLNNLNKCYLGDYGVTPQKLGTFCELDWLSIGVGRPAEGFLNREIITKVSQVITSQPGHPDQFSYIDSWEAIVHT